MLRAVSAIYKKGKLIFADEKMMPRDTLLGTVIFRCLRFQPDDRCRVRNSREPKTSNATFLESSARVRDRIQHVT